MITEIILFLLCTLVSRSGDETVLATAERYFFQEDYQQAAEYIEAHQWSDQLLWNRAGLLGELCTGGWSIECPLMSPGEYNPFTAEIRILLTGRFQAGDSVRVCVPVPAELPWQTPLGEPEVSVSGINGSAQVFDSWLVVEGCAEETFSITVTQQVSTESRGFVGVDAPGTEEAMVPFPGEDVFLDKCLNTDEFWAGEDLVYMESVRLAAREPNPVRLVQRVIDRVSGNFRGFASVDQNVLLYPSSTLALQGSLNNSLGGASLGASILRRWQIPALVVPGRTGQTGIPGFLLCVYVKPFGWMTVSPYPAGFIALGGYQQPEHRSWINGVPGICFHAEYLGANGFWNAIPFNSSDFSHSVEIVIR